MNLKPIFLSFGLLAMASPVYASQTYPLTNGTAPIVQSDQGDDAGDSIPGTDIIRPKNDIKCDQAFDDGDWDKALPLCLSSEKGYKAIVGKLKGVPKSKTFEDPQTGDTHNYSDVYDSMMYDAAYTNWQIATCYKMKGTPELGRMFGGIAYNQYREVHDGYWRALNKVLKRSPDDHSKITYGKLSKDTQDQLDKALTENQATLAADFVALMMKVHLIYPEIFAQEAKEYNDGKSNVDEN